jgi:hypothetical protein
MTKCLHKHPTNLQSVIIIENKTCQQSNLVALLNNKNAILGCTVIKEDQCSKD